MTIRKMTWFFQCFAEVWFRFVCFFLLRFVEFSFGDGSDVAAVGFNIANDSLRFHFKFLLLPVNQILPVIDNSPRCRVLVHFTIIRHRARTEVSESGRELVGDL